MVRAPLVGRRAEVGALTEAIEDARAGNGGLALLVGEPGIGKSRLAEEAARVAGGLGVAVAWGRAWEAGGAPPYWPWIQVLRDLAVERAPVAARLLGETARDGAPLSPENRFLLFDAVARHLVAAAAGQPIVAILEDLHAADEPTLHLLAFLAGHLRGAPLLVIGTYRDVEARISPAASVLLERVAREARVIAPRRLAREDVVAIAAASPDVPLDDEALGALHRQSEGNPLFVTELLRVAARGGAIAVPAGVRAAIREHLRRLPPELRPLLDAAAAVGRDVAAPVVAELTGRPLAEVADGLARAVELGVLVERGRGLAFSHGLIAETLHHDLPAARRAELHLAIADGLERAHLGDPQPPLAEIAHHLFDAGPDQTDRAVATARRAATQMRRQLAFEAAAALIERALAVVAPSSAPERYELTRLLGEVCILGGDRTRGQDACREAAAIARALGSPELLARAALTYGTAWNFGTTDHVLVQLSEESLATLPPGDSPLRARLMARLAAALQPSPDSEPPMVIAREAIAMADRLGDDATRLEVLHGALGALALFAPPAERRALAAESLALAERLGEPLIALRACSRLFFDCMELGDVGGVEHYRRRYTDLADELRVPRARWPAAMMRAMVAMMQGRFADHDEALAEARRLAEDARDDFFERTAMPGHRMTEQRVRGDEAAIRRDRGLHFIFANVAASRGVVFREVTAMVHARLGELEEARALLTVEQAEMVARHRLVGLGVYAAEVAWRLGDPQIAAPLYGWLSDQGERVSCLHHHGFAVDIPAAHGAMLLASVLGDPAAARRHFEVAHKVVRAMGARPLEAWLLRDWAEILGDTDEARAHLASARAIADELGIALARPRGAITSPPPPPVVDTIELRCEGELWRVNGLGETCLVRASRGVELLARLVEEPGREHHVLELAGEGEGAADGGDSGEMIDTEARAAYRARVIELREALDEALAWNDPVRAERAREELEAIEAELSRATGLGGRARRSGRAAERARINVQRRLTDAIRRIGAAAPTIGEHLGAAVRTGTYCSYVPDRRRPRGTS